MTVTHWVVCSLKTLLGGYGIHSWCLSELLQLCMLYSTLQSLGYKNLVARVNDTNVLSVRFYYVYWCIR